MNKWIMGCFFMGVVLVNHAQEIFITDKTSGEALEFVTIYSKKPYLLAITNAEGKADLSKFVDADSIMIRISGYATLYTSYDRLKSNDFSISMEALVTSLNEVLVSAYTKESVRRTSLHIETLESDKIDELGTYNLTDALARINGISQLGTGIGVSKPAIRGLYGNRILVLFSGLRFDNQQWQDEHGLGLSNIGIAKAEVIKGPLSLLYGTEAIGGVINIIEENEPKAGIRESDAGMVFHSNTLGGTFQAGTRANYGNKWYRLRMAISNHADYSDGTNRRVINSRFNGYHLKSTFGFSRKNWRSDNHYHFSYNNFGFIFNDLSHFMEVDNRWSRKMAGPHHKVMLHVVSSNNTIKLSKSILNFNTGFQSNLRSEDEGGNELSLKMLLSTYQYALKWEKVLGERTEMVLAHNAIIENNTNYGRRKIVPDAWMTESSFSGYLKHDLKSFILEYGMGGGVRHIKTLLTPDVNNNEKEMNPFSRFWPFYNSMLGINVFPHKKFQIKLVGATGVRTPNLAELSSNGLHEGVYTYEIGDPDMTREMNFNGDISLFYNGKVTEFNVSAYYNHFDNYIYLEPTQEEWFGFPVSRFRQKDARIYGFEAEGKLKPKTVKGLSISGKYSQLIGQMLTGEYLPYMPAQKLKPEVRYDFLLRKQNKSYAFVNNAFVFQQQKVNPYESPTPAYFLLNAGIGTSIQTNTVNYAINVTANNLLNEAYFDHLSRLKNFGLLNMGRDISIHLKITFINKIKESK